jgi:hypothetical protein
MLSFISWTSKPIAKQHIQLSGLERRMLLRETVLELWENTFIYIYYDPGVGK